MTTATEIMIKNGPSIGDIIESLQAKIARLEAENYHLRAENYHLRMALIEAMSKLEEHQ